MIWISQEIDALWIITFQPSSLQRQSQDEKSPQLQRLQRILSNRSLIMVLEVELAYEGRSKRMFAQQF